MEVPCVHEGNPKSSPTHEGSGHAASLLASLNLQRERAQFCDCVVMQTQNPGHLYPAHRCVLSACSPVLASILSSTGALVELQAPCLSDSILALLLAFIYTGALPYTPSQQQCYNLLSAAGYLQIDELQEILRVEMKAADNSPESTGTENQQYRDSHDTYSRTLNTFGRYLPSSHSCSVHSLDRKDCQYSANVDTLKDMDTYRSTRGNGSNHCEGTEPSPLSIASTGCGVSGTAESRVNTGNSRQVTHFTPQEVIKNNPFTAEERRVTEVDKKAQRDRFHSADFATLEARRKSSEADTVRAVEDRRSSHVSRADEAEEQGSSRVEETPRLCLTVKSNAEAQQSDRQEENHTPEPLSPTLFLSNSHRRESVSPSQCSGAVPVIRHSGQVAQLQLAEVSTVPPYYPISGMNGSSHTAEHHDYTHCDSFQSMNHSKSLTDNSVPHGKDRSNFSRKLEYRTDLSFDDFPSKRQQLNCPDVPMAAEGQSGHSHTRSDSHCEELCPKGEAKEEHSYSNVMRSRDPACSQGQHDSEKEDLATAEERRIVDVFLSVSTTPESSLDSVECNLSACEHGTSLEPDKNTSTEVGQPHPTFPVAEDNTSDPTCSLVGQSYRGHIHYHCLPQEDTRVGLSHGNWDHEHPHCSHPAYSDRDSDEGEGGTFASPGCSPWRRHFGTGPADQVLLLDISAQPAELLVSYKHRSDEESKWVAFGQEDTIGRAFGSNDREQWDDATSVTGVDERKRARARRKCGARQTRYWDGEPKSPTKKPVGRERRSRPVAEVVHGAGFVDGADQVATLTACSPPSVPDSTRASMSSSLSVWIPPTLSAGVRTNISAHLSAPLGHPFQCSLCERSFSQRGSLNRHVRSHLGVRPFPCPRCPMTFSRQYRVTEHMRVHQRCALGSDPPKTPASLI